VDRARTPALPLRMRDPAESDAVEPSDCTPRSRPIDERDESPDVIVTRTSRVWLDREGILQEADNPGSEQDLTDAQENVAANARLAQGRRLPLLVDMSQVKSITRQARTYYAKEAPKVVCACALVVGSPLSRMMGNFFIGFNRPLIPLKLFSTTTNAAAWLRQFVENRVGCQRGASR